MNENENAAKETEAEMIQVMTRFTRAELDQMKEETGANADATAVACFCRKILRCSK